MWYRVAATGAHEGSLLLWVLLLSVWTFAVAIFSRRMPLDAVARVLAVMGMIAFGFLLFILLTSNPFSRGLPQYPIDGRDLNPLLQDIGMIFHPPILYMGYVGFRWLSPSPSPRCWRAGWILLGRAGRVPDPCGMDVPHPRHRAGLGVGILRTGLGRLVVLGPGGKRLVYAVAGGNRAAALPGGDRKAGSFRARTVLLAIAAFSLCLLGTFPVRSGVLVSVHAFASDPSRGLFILVLLIVAIGGSLLLYALKGGRCGRGWNIRCGRASRSCLATISC